MLTSFCSFLGGSGKTGRDHQETRWSYSFSGGNFWHVLALNDIFPTHQSYNHASSFEKKMIYDILHVTFLTNSGMLPYDINLRSLNPFCECLFKLIIRSTNCQPFSFITLFNFAWLKYSIAKDKTWWKRDIVAALCPTGGNKDWEVFLSNGKTNRPGKNYCRERTFRSLRSSLLVSLGNLKRLNDFFMLYSYMFLHLNCVYWVCVSF